MKGSCFIIQLFLISRLFCAAEKSISNALTIFLHKSSEAKKLLLQSLLHDVKKRFKAHEFFSMIVDEDSQAKRKHRKNEAKWRFAIKKKENSTKHFEN